MQSRGDGLKISPKYVGMGFQGFWWFYEKRMSFIGQTYGTGEAQNNLKENWKYSTLKA